MVMDPESGNEGLGNAGVIGRANHAPRTDEVLVSSSKTAGFAPVSLLEMTTGDQLGYLTGCM